MTDKQIIFDDVNVKDCIAYAKLQEIYLGNTLYKQTEKVCMVKNQPCKFFDCQFKQMARELKAKEQECDELNNDNHTLLVTRQKLLNDLWIAEESLKDFKEICDKQCEQLETYKMEAEEGKEINAELKAELEQEKNWHKNSDEISKANSEYTAKLKAENEELKRQHQGDKGLITSTGKMNYQLLQEYDKLENCLTKIKEIAQYDVYTSRTYLCLKLNWIKKKISECEVGNE